MPFRSEIAIDKFKGKSYINVDKQLCTRPVTDYR